jgi:phosphoribosylaminoimidazole-succinocarboxamide synthase
VNNKLLEDGNRILLETDNEDELLLQFTDDLVDSRGHVKGNVKIKGSTSAQIAAHLYKVLSSYHLPVRFKNQKSSKELTVKRATLFPFYNVLTNAEDEDGAMTSKLEYVVVDEKSEEVVEIKALLKDDLATQAQLTEVRRYSLKMNVILKDFFHRRGLKLLGFKAHFGMLPNEKIGLCSELTLDSCDVKDANSRTKFTTTYMISHIDDAAELYEKAVSTILY